MKFSIQLLSAAVGALALGSIVIFFMVDFPLIARVAYAGREAEAFHPGEAGFVMVQLAIQAIAAFFALYCLTRRVGRRTQNACFAAVIIATILSLLDLYWLPVLSVIQAVAFIGFTLRTRPAVTT